MKSFVVYNPLQILFVCWKARRLNGAGRGRGDGSVTYGREVNCTSDFGWKTWRKKMEYLGLEAKVYENVS
jgi:hypothetical protein